MGYETSNIPLIIWKNSEHKKICEAFIEYLYQPEYYVPFVLSVPGGMLPALKDVAKDPAFTSNVVIKNHSHAIEVIADSINTGTAIGMEFGPRAEAGLLTSQGVIENMFQQIVINNIPVKKAAQEAENKLNDLFETL